MCHQIAQGASMLCDCTTLTKLEKLQSEVVAMHTGIWCFHILRVNQKLIKWTRAEPFKMNKITRVASSMPKR